MILSIILFGVMTVISEFLLSEKNYKLKGVHKVSYTLILFIISLVYTIIGFHWFKLMITIGLFFSCIGDGYLYIDSIKPESKLFGKVPYLIMGIILFLIGYLCYGISLWILSPVSYINFVSAAMFLALIIMHLLLLSKEKLFGVVRIGILVYMIQLVIFVSGASSLLISNFSKTGSILIAIGAFMIFLSDNLIGFKLFSDCEKKYDMEIKIMTTYRIGQTCILLGTILII
jgi:hypothetical protein